MSENAKSEQYQEKTGREAVKCPSTSPANAFFTLDRLAEAWSRELF